MTIFADGPYLCTKSIVGMRSVKMLDLHAQYLRFKDEIDAALAYNQAAIKYHGEFAKLNETNKGDQEAR